MKDSDWVYFNLASGGAAWADPDSLDIYSESDAFLTAMRARFFFHYRAVMQEPLAFAIGLGFIYQFFDNEVKNLDQWYPSYSRYDDYLPAIYDEHMIVKGTILTYRAEYFIPAINTALHGLWGPVALTVALGFSPCAFARDHDDHVLRYKRGKGKALGFAAFSSVSLEYVFAKIVILGVFADIFTVWSKGEQRQTQYQDYSGIPKGYIGTVENRIMTRQVSLGLKFAVRL